MRIRTLGVSLALILGSGPYVTSQSVRGQEVIRLDEDLFGALEYRLVGPFRGGRSAAVVGIPGDRDTYYFGSTGGGVWQTDDAGRSWRSVSDGFFGGSIGAVAVSEWDPNVIYVGGGEKTVRGNVSHGYGMFKSLDAGKTWSPAGLEDSRHIPRIRIHPRDPDLVYAAVLGHLFGPNQQRGVFRSRDGGETWERVLFVNENTGAVDLILDPTNPRVIYAGMWRVRRTPYSLESGGEGSGLWKSTDGGDTWSDISRNPGLPEGTLGIVGVTVSPARPSRLWAIVEADEGGVFRSDDAGETWTLTNAERKLRQRAWYYTRIYADPVEENGLYVLNVSFWRSKDGGRTFESIKTPHGDHHDLWIDPGDPDRMIIADDGGAQVSSEGGDTWSTYHNQPTAQFYRVATDNHFPYRIYGAQQDNSTVRILSRGSGSSIDEEDWEPTAGGESGHIAPHPENPDIVYGGSYGGFLQRLDHRTGRSRSINVWPDNPMGHAAGDLRYRFQWNYPLFFSPHDANILYAAANVLLQSNDEGQSWEPISPDLTRADPSTLGSSGGPITRDNTSVEYYATIFAAAESTHEAGVLWAGSDDGLIHVSRNAGQTWTNVTPPPDVLPEWAMINDIVINPFEPGGVYIAATRYKSDDFTPYLIKTRDYGRTWTRITNGIEADHFTRAVEADPARRGLLYAGTESGMYISFDDGQTWQPFQQNLPVVPVTDLAIKDDDLILATQGRSFWIMDDLTPLHQLDLDVLQADVHVFEPRPALRVPEGHSRSPVAAGENPPAGLVLRYMLREEPPDSVEVRVTILEDDGTPIRTFSSADADEADRPPAKTGLNSFVWDMRYPDSEGFDGLIMWSGSLRGPLAIPGSYLARLVVGETEREIAFEIVGDPRSSASPSDYIAQFDFLEEAGDKLTETHRAIKRIREIRGQIDGVVDRAEDVGVGDEVRAAADALRDSLTAVEEALYQTRNESNQDPLNYPIRLNNRLSALAAVVSRGDYPPTDQAVEVKEELVRLIDEELARLDRVLENQVPAFNAFVSDNEVPPVVVPLLDE